MEKLFRLKTCSSLNNFTLKEQFELEFPNMSLSKTEESN